MYKETTKYVDFNGNEQTEDLMFNLTRTELIELETETEGGLEETINKISNEQDTKKLIDLFKKILVKSYGKVSEDGKRFIKNDAMKEEFMQSAAYDEMFMSLATDADKAQKFINSILPRELVAAQQAAIPAPAENK